MNFDDLKKPFQYTIQVGVISGKSKNDRSDPNSAKGVTNAELMYIMENGSPLRDIPSRPVLQLTIDHVKNDMMKKIVDKGIEAYLKTGEAGLEKILSQNCMRIQSYAQQHIYDDDFPIARNAPSTIARKGFDHPLFVTGQLARSITCQWVKGGDK